jgi:ubiquinone/menaquinone biosynthesis C-methylase UbiE
MMPFDHFNFIAPIFSRVGYASFETMQEFAALPVAGRVLDAGGGTGRVADMLRELADGVVIADPSLGMLRQADRTRLGLACANSEMLPFPDECFERIIMVDALHHVAHQGKTACELYRVLRRGGRIVIEEPDIRTFGIKLVAVAEKLLLMRSHFLSPDDIVNLFSFDHARATIKEAESNAWIIIDKPA